MKTAEEIYYQPNCTTKRQIIEAIKSYGRQCAEQALIDAANRVYEKMKFTDYKLAQTDEILNTPIVTP